MSHTLLILIHSVDRAEFRILFHCQAFTASHNPPRRCLLISCCSHFWWPWPPRCFPLFCLRFFHPRTLLPHASLLSDFFHPSPLPLWSPAVKQIQTTFLSSAQAKSRCCLQSCCCTLIGQCSNLPERSHLLDKSSTNPGQALRDFRLIRNEFTRPFVLYLIFFVLSFVLTLSLILFHLCFIN